MKNRIGVLFIFLLTSLNLSANDLDGLRRQCTLGNGMNCYSLGLLYVRGEKIEQSFKKANFYFKQACNLNNAGGCTELAFSYYKARGVNHP